MNYVDKDFLTRSLERKREYILEHFPDEIASFDSALEFVMAVPPDDVCKVVRCFECVNYGGREWENYESGICARTDCGVGKDDFCSYGVTHE